MERYCVSKFGWLVNCFLFGVVCYYSIWLVYINLIWFEKILLLLNFCDYGVDNSFNFLFNYMLYLVNEDYIRFGWFYMNDCD